MESQKKDLRTSSDMCEHAEKGISLKEEGVMTGNLDYSGATAKSDPLEISLVKKLDYRIMPTLWAMYFLNYVSCIRLSHVHWQRRSDCSISLTVMQSQVHDLTISRRTWGLSDRNITPVFLYCSLGKTLQRHDHMYDSMS